MVRVTLMAVNVSEISAKILTGSVSGVPLSDMLERRGGEEVSYLFRIYLLLGERERERERERETMFSVV